MSRARASAPKAEDRPGTWTAYGKVPQRLRKRAGLPQEQLAESVGYSLEQTASIEQGRRSTKAAFTTTAARVLEDLQEEVDFAELPAFFRLSTSPSSSARQLSETLSAAPTS